MRRLLSYVAPQLPTILAGSLLLLFATLAELGVPSVAGALLDIYTNAAGDEQVGSRVDRALLRLMGLIAGMSACKHAGEYLLKSAGERAVVEVRSRLFLCQLTCSVQSLEEQPTGHLLSSLTAGSDAVRLCVTHHLPQVARSVASCLVASVYMASISPRLTLLAFGIAPLLGLLAAAVGTRVRALAQEQQRQASAATSVAAEALSAARCIKAFGGEAAVGAKYAAEAEAYYTLSMREMALHKLWNGGNLLLGGVATLGVVREAGRQVLSGALSAGSVSSFAVYGVATGYAASDAAHDTGRRLDLGGTSAAPRLHLGCRRPAGGVHPRKRNTRAPRKGARVQAANGWARAAASAASASHALSLLDEGEARAAAEAAAEAGSSCAAPEGAAASHVELEVVGFCYPAAKQPALDSLTLSLAADKMTALVGPSGGGKSSALSLLLRFYQPTAGCITIGGVRLERLPNRWLREHVGVVAQEPTLFRGTFHDNIAFGARRAPPEGEWSAELLEREVRRAAVAANAHGFISTAGGYGAAIGERGGGLSGGQRQRIALARAYLRAPSVLLLDEATASLDAESERAVHDALALLARGRAVLTVAHRLATVRAADEIVVLERGRVVERGTHEALVAAAGLYARLNALQTHSDS